jgi:ankyrin repeat protein
MDLASTLNHIELLFWPGSLPGYVCELDCSAPSYMSKASILLCLFVGAVIVRRWWAVPLGAALAIVTFAILGQVAGSSTWRGGLYGEPFIPLSLSEFAWKTASETFSPHSWSFLSVGAVLFNLLITALAFGCVRAVAGLWKLNVAARALRATVLGALLLPFSGFLLLKSSPELLPRSVLEPAAIMLNYAPRRCTVESAKQLPDWMMTREQDKSGRATGSPLREATLAEFDDLPTVQRAFMKRVGLATQAASIRVPDPSRFGTSRAITLLVVIDAFGNVIAATPKSGPTELYGKAKEIASHWKFERFTNRGLPTNVKFGRAVVYINGPEKRGTEERGDTLATSSRDLLVKYSQSFYGESFTLWVRGDGTVTFEGRDGVALEGLHCARISQESLKRIMRSIHASGAFSMQDQFNTRMTSRYLTIAIGDRVKEIAWSNIHSESDSEKDNAPQAGWMLIDELLEAVLVERWLNGDSTTASSLDAEAWDAKGKSPENIWMTARITAYGNLQALSSVLEFGAPVASAPEAAGDGPTYKPYKWTALEAAAFRSSIARFEFLRGLDVKWSQRALDAAYVDAVAGNLQGVAKVLEQWGANPRGANESGTTPVMAASFAGDLDALKNLASVDGIGALDRSGNALLHFAAVRDDMLSLEVSPIIARKRTEVIRYLAARGVGVDTRNELGQTALHVNGSGLPEVTSTLIALGADVNAQDDDGNTPLMTNKSLRAVQLLLKAGANPLITNRRGQSALDVARSDVHAQNIAVEIELWMRANPTKK